MIKFFYFVLSLMLLCSCDPFDTQIEKDENTVLSYQAKNISLITDIPTPLKIATWNIKFGGGRIDFFFDCLGNRSLMNKNEVEQNLTALVEKINQVNPDVIFLQEVDILSKRSAYVDMVQWILDHTALNYGVYASQWKADYVPSDGIGRVNSGNVILSKYPLSESERIALPLENQSKIVQYFYLRRNILKTKVSIGTQEIYLLNTHFTAYGEDNLKQEHVTILKNQIDELNKNGHIFIAGGDFNMIPPYSIKKSDFPDAVCPDSEDDNYEGEENYLMPLYDTYQFAVPLKKYQANNAPYFSHSVDKNQFWNRKIDYLLTNKTFVENSEITHQNSEQGGLEMMSRSDHAMLSVEF